MVKSKKELVAITGLAQYAIEERDRGREKGSWEVRREDRRWCVVRTWAKQPTKIVNVLADLEAE